MYVKYLLQFLVPRKHLKILAIITYITCVNEYVVVYGLMCISKHVFMDHSGIKHTVSWVYV